MKLALIFGLHCHMARMNQNLGQTNNNNVDRVGVGGLIGYIQKWPAYFVFCHS